MEHKTRTGAIIDDRRSERDKAQTWGFVVATDSFMSGWGEASGKFYFAVPVRSPQEAEIASENMSSRPEMEGVRIVDKSWKPSLNRGDHLSIRGIDECEKYYRPGGFSA